MEMNHTEHRSFSTHLIQIIKGLFLGWTTSLPFFSISSLKECVKKEDSSFEEENFGKRLLLHLHENYTYFIGFMVGFLLFFFIPFKTLIPTYPIATYAGLGALILPFLASEVFLFIRSFKKDKVSILSSSIIFVVIFALSMLLYFVLQDKTYFDMSSFSFGLVLVYVIITMSSFISCFSGLGIGTLLFFMHMYLPYEESMRTFVYKDFSYLPLAIFSLLGLLSGYVLHQALLYFVRRDFGMEKRASSIAFYLAGLILILATKIKEPWYIEDKVITETAQLFVTLASVMGCLFLSFTLSAHRYSFMNKEEYSKPENSNHEA